MGSPSSEVEQIWPAKSKTEVCAFFGVTEKTIRDWQAKGMPGSPKNWDLGAIARWRIQRAIAEVERIDSNGKPKSKRERDKDREQAAKADQMEIKVRRELRELVEVKEIRGFISLTTGKLRDALDRLQRDCGERAFAIVSEVLDEIDRDLDGGMLDQKANAD